MFGPIQAYFPHAVFPPLSGVEAHSSVIPGGFSHSLDSYCCIHSGDPLSIGGGAPPNRPLQIIVAGDTDTGLVREKNEDSHAILPDKKLFLLADGMGGHLGGRVASQMAVRLVGALFQVESGMSPQDRTDRLMRSIEIASRQIFERSKRDRNVQGMGTTLVALHLDEIEGRFYAAHAGDSRIYRIRKDAIEQLTEDHSLINAWRKMGLPARSTEALPKHIITRALGLEELIEVDVTRDRLEDDDLFLLCSDGLTDVLFDDAIREIILAHEDLEAAAKELVRRANEGGGIDNITVVLVRASRPPAPRESV